MSSANDDELQIEVASEYLRSLANWLSSEAELRGRVRAVRPAPEPGKMGSAIELLTVALGSGGAGAVLIKSICGWLSQRSSEVSITLKDSSGSECQFTAKSKNLDPAEAFREASTQFAALRGENAGQEQADR